LPAGLRLCSNIIASSVFDTNFPTYGNRKS
jgi:hypothetical protein